MTCLISLLYVTEQESEPKGAWFKIYALSTSLLVVTKLNTSAFKS